MKKMLTLSLAAAAAVMVLTIPAMAEESKKIAVIRNMTSSDHTAQFFKGATEEG